MDNRSKVFVAGHRGLVGSALIRHLRRRGYDRIITRTRAELDLRDQHAVRGFFQSERPDAVFLAAARVGGILANSTYPAEFIYDNLMIASNVIEASQRFGVSRLLNLGSSCIFPKFAPQPMTEDQLLTGTLEATNEAYAVAKIAAIKLCRYFNAQYGTQYISAMPANLYGPGDSYDLERSHVLPALLRKFHLSVLLKTERWDELRKDIAGRSLGFGLSVAPEAPPKSIADVLGRIGVTADAVTIWGSGEPYREFLHVDDLAAACMELMEHHTPETIGEFINVGTGSDIRIRELAEMIGRIVGFSGSIVFDRSKPDGTPRKLLDVSRLRRLGWAPAIPLEEGIRSTYREYAGQTDAR